VISDYLAHDACGLASLVSTGKVTATELRDTALELMANDAAGLNALTQVIEETAPPESFNGTRFAGVPFLLKELVAQKGRRLTFGSRAYHDHVASHDHPTASRAREAGLQVVGRTTCSEFGLTPTCFSELYGQTLNPWSLERDPGGSSGGAAVAVAAGYVPMAQGGDAGGSIRIPAAACGLFGFISTRGEVPLPGSNVDGLLRHGVMSRSVRDSIAFLEAFRREDAGSRWSPVRAARPRAPGDPLRIVLLGPSFCGGSIDEEHRDAAVRAAALCESLGHRVDDLDLEILPDEAIAPFHDLLAVGAARAVMTRTRERPDVGGLFEPWTLYLADRGRRLGAVDIYSAFDALDRLSRRIAGLFETYDLVLHPTLLTPVWTIGEIRSTPLDETFSRIERCAGGLHYANVCGLPAMSVPLAWSRAGLPIGIHFMGQPGADDVLLALAQQLEEAEPWSSRWAPHAAARLAQGDPSPVH
jgi:amidase